MEKVPEYKLKKMFFPRHCSRQDFFELFSTVCFHVFVQACNSDQYVAVPREDMARMLKQKGQSNTPAYMETHSVMWDVVYFYCAEQNTRGRVFMPALQLLMCL